MVAIIKTGKSIYGALAYNEKKVEQGAAVSLGVISSIANAEKQRLRDKADSLQKLADRNPRTKRNSVHIALSFAKDDRLNGEQLRSIAKDYLKGIGFGNQPAYLYRHQDTANDHIHLVTTNITREGKRIDDSFVGATKSEVTRKEIEETYKLVKAEEQGRARDTAQRLSEKSAPQGEDQGELRSYARHTIRDTLGAYRPATLGELNALLQDRDLKVRQERGQTPDGAEWRGYSVVRRDARTGQESSAAIKASKIFEKGWGSKLDKTLAVNGGEATRVLDQVKGRVGEAFANGRSSMDEVKAVLEQNGIRTVHHHTEQGRRFGVHYIDERSGYVFKASQLGRGYTAAEWNRREQTNTLSPEDYERLMKDAKQYVVEQTARVGYRSVVIKRLATEELQFAMAQLGHRSELVGPYLAEVVAAEKRDYASALKHDRQQVKDLHRGLAQVQAEFRAPLMASLGLERRGDKVVLRNRREVSQPGQQSRAGGVGEGPAMGQLSAGERRMLVGVGRRHGIGNLPLDVNVSTIDWKYWEGKFKPAAAEKLGRQLHQNYIKQELSLLHRGGGSKGIDHPLIRLAGQGILIKPTETGHEAHTVGQEKYAYPVPDKLSPKIYREDYNTEHYVQLKFLLEEKLGEEVLGVLQQAKLTRLRSGSGKRQSVPNSLAGELRGYLTSRGGEATRSGLYKILRSMDEDENITQEERKRNRGLRL